MTEGERVVLAKSAGEIPILAIDCRALLGLPEDGELRLRSSVVSSFPSAASAYERQRCTARKDARRRVEGMVMRYVFGEYTLDSQGHELRRVGRLLKLRPKVFQLLVHLMAQRHRVVTKQELLEHLWPGQFVGDAALLSCIQAARQAVGDNGHTQHVIRTVHRHGYRLSPPWTWVSQ